jgi:hypothetical protein
MKVTRGGILLAVAGALLGGTPFPRTVSAGSLDPYALAPYDAMADGLAEADLWPENKTDGAQHGHNEPTTERRRPKTLLNWMVGPHERTEDKEEPEQEQERLDPDRPHLAEASTTVGKGRIVLESGYTFTEKGSSFSSHSYPEALLRIGMFADWFEFRVGQNVVNEAHTTAGVRTRGDGAQDLYLGVKLALTAQKQYLPQVALIPQITVPTGSKAVTAGRVLPGLNVDSSWEVIKDRFSIELLTAINRVADDIHHAHVEVTTGLTGVFQLTRALEAFMEWDAFYPIGTIVQASGPRHYAVGGLVYFITKDFEVDIRAGVGLNRQANDFLAGAGFAVRY